MRVAPIRKDSVGFSPLYIYADIYWLGGFGVAVVGDAGFFFLGAFFVGTGVSSTMIF